MGDTVIYYYKLWEAVFWGVLIGDNNKVCWGHVSTNLTGQLEDGLCGFSLCVVGVGLNGLSH